MNIILIIIIAITAIFSFMAPNGSQLFEKYKFNVGAILDRKEYIRLLSAGFLHADLMHLFFNMLTLFFFAPTVIYGAPHQELQMFVPGFGDVGFLIIYFGSILVGNLFSLYLYRNQSWYSAIGASGGVSGILFAAVALSPFDVSVYFIPGFLFGALYFGYSVYMMLNPRPHDNIGHAAHLGGAFFGLVYSIAVQPNLALVNAKYLAIMALPLIYLGYQVFVKKRIG